MTEQPPTEEEPLDYAQLVITSWRAIRRHHLSELEAVIAGEVVSLSFVNERPFAWVQHRIDLVRLTGVPKNKIYSVLTRLKSSGVLELTTVGDGYLLTFLPPSPEWPWVPQQRTRSIPGGWETERLEAQLVHETRHWPGAQVDFMPPSIEHEWQQAMAVARMRVVLYQRHQQAADLALSGRGIVFPVTDCLPGGPAFTGLSSQGQTRPLETGQSSGVTANSVPEISGEERANPDNLTGTLKGTQDESGTLLGTQNGTLLGSRPLRVLESKSYLKLLDSETLKAGDPKRDPATAADRKRAVVQDLGHLDPGAEEEDVLAWLTRALSEPVMQQWGAHWRLSIREDRKSVIEACYQLRLRISDSQLMPPRNRGGWLRDQYRRLHNLALRELQERISKPPVNNPN